MKRLLIVSLFTAGVLLLTATITSTIAGVRTTTPDTKVIDVNDFNTTKVLNSTLNKKLTLKELDMSGNRQVYVFGVIDEISAPPVAEKILELGKSAEPINVIINSPGGSVVDGATIISAMEAAKGPVNTICVELCASMAAMIHQSGTNRLMLNRALVMFHPASGGVEGEVDKSASRLATLQRYIGKMENNVANRSGISYEEYKRLSGVELWLDAEDAYNRKFADGVVFVRGPDAAKVIPVSPLAGLKVAPRRLIIETKPFSPLIPNFMWF